MSITTKIMKHYAGKALRSQLQSEYELWRASGVPAGDYVRDRVPTLFDSMPAGDLAEYATRFRSSRVSAGDVRKRSETSASLKDRAAELERLADAARAHLQQIETRVAALSDERDALTSIEDEAQQRVEELVSLAQSEADQQIATAQRRLAEMEDRAALHVEEVERRAKVTANSIVTDAKAKFARTEASAFAELDHARLNARVANEKAEAAMERARVAAELFANTAEDAAEATEERAEARSSVLRDVMNLAGRRAASAEQGRFRQTRASVAIADLDDLDQSELYSLARSLNIPGRSQMSKSELREALEATL